MSCCHRPDVLRNFDLHISPALQTISRSLELKVEPIADLKQACMIQHRYDELWLRALHDDVLQSAHLVSDVVTAECRYSCPGF
jgi:hypothetical protein